MKPVTDMIEGGIEVNYRCNNCGKEIGTIISCGYFKKPPHLSKVVVDEITGEIKAKLTERKELYLVPKVKSHICTKGSRKRGVAYLTYIDDWHWAMIEEIEVFLKNSE